MRNKDIRAWVKRNEIPAKVITQLENTLKKARKDRWAFNGDVWDLEKWIQLAKEGKASKLAVAIIDADTDLRERLTQHVYNWACNLDE